MTANYTMQKAMFWKVKGHVLQRNRPYSATQKAAFCIIKQCITGIKQPKQARISILKREKYG